MQLPPQAILEPFHYPQKKTPNTFIPYPKALAITNLLSISGFACLGTFLEMESHSTWSLVSGFFHLAKCLQGSFVLKHLSILHYFLLPINIPLYGYTTFYLSIHQLMAVWAVSTNHLDYSE